MKNKENKMIRMILVGLVTLSLSPAMGKIMNLKGIKIRRTLTDTTPSFNGCMILLNKPVGGVCIGSWVSLDCDGKFSSNGNLLFKSVTTAAVAGKQVELWVNDAQKTKSGYCTLRRVDVIY